MLKGGLLISSMIGIEARTKMDMDTTVRGIQLEEEEIVKIFKEILAIDTDDGITFEYQCIEPIREEDAYNNFRIHIAAKYGKINSPMKVDVTTGDKITPAASQYDYPFIFEDKTVSIMAYTIETVLAEKYETIIRRNIGNTRARDFYDLHVLYHERKDSVRPDILKMAIEHTAVKRESMDMLKDWKDIMRDMREETALYSLWRNYAAENSYAEGLEFHVLLDTVEEIAKLIDIE
nr:nucleotidyl transferase AbiEii/AbiGii toxin family protein [Petralouisia muris]